MSVTLNLSSIFIVIQRSTCVFRIGIPVFDPGFGKSGKYYVEIWPLNDLNAENQSFIKVNF